MGNSNKFVNRWNIICDTRNVCCNHGTCWVTMCGYFLNVNPCLHFDFLYMHCNWWLWFFCWLGRCVYIWTLVGINECLVARLQALLHMCAFTFFMIEISIKTNRGQNCPWLDQTNHSCQKLIVFFIEIIETTNWHGNIDLILKLCIYYCINILIILIFFQIKLQMNPKSH